jgi:hypothetical protein
MMRIANEPSSQQANKNRSALAGLDGSMPGGSMALFDDEVRITDRKKIVILGGGPNRIGQGIEFDYCCVHAAFAARNSASSR